MSLIEVSTDYGGRLLSLQTGKLAKQTDASVLVQYGETVVLVTVVSAKNIKEGIDFFPLTVDFQEKFYAAGRFPGGFFKRESKPSEKATLSARMIDRPIRPLFPEDYLAETHVVATVLSVDGVNEPEIAATIGASAALHISDIPWAGPVGCCRVGLRDGEFIANVTPEDQEESEVDLLICGIRDGVVMVEGKANEVSERQMLDGIEFAHKLMQPILDLQDELREKVGNVAKREYEKPERDEALFSQLKEFLPDHFKAAFSITEKLKRYEALDDVKKLAKEKFGVAEPAASDEVQLNKNISQYYGELKAQFARSQTLETQKRIDGRSYRDIRDIHCEVGLLPRTHGSSLFTRGETQALAVVTLGTADDEQKIDSIAGVFNKAFMLHYNFPPFSVGEARPLRPPSRREIGHGFLAERALEAVVPSKEDFPYAIRLCSEVLESNGSSSMATVCSGSMAMMDAGVPLTRPVAGVAMGLIKEGDAIAVLSDILGDEDHLGDMDFKVCGTEQGVTAFQMDLKIAGVTRDIMDQALQQANEARFHILNKMKEAIEHHREEISVYAPRIYKMRVKPEKVREVIGAGGKVIKGIIEQTGVKIDIEDDGTIHIASSDPSAADRAIEIIEGITADAQPGQVYEGKVTRIVDFGAFIEILPGKEGLCHISELEHHRVNNVEDVLTEGEMVKVKCLEVDTSGKIRLSRKALLNSPELDEEERDELSEDEEEVFFDELEEFEDDEQPPKRSGNWESRGDRGDRGGDRGNRGGRDRGSYRDRDDNRGNRDDNRGNRRHSRGGDRDYRGGSESREFRGGGGERDGNRRDRSSGGARGGSRSMGGSRGGRSTRSGGSSGGGRGGSRGGRSGGGNRGRGGSRGSRNNERYGGGGGGGNRY